MALAPLASSSIRLMTEPNLAEPGTGLMGDTALIPLELSSQARLLVLMVGAIVGLLQREAWMGDVGGGRSSFGANLLDPMYSLSS